MKRSAIVGLIAFAAGSTAAIAAAAAQPPAQLRQFVCHRALDPSARAVSIVAVMRPLPGTRKMALRVELLRKSSSARSYTQVAGHDLGTWVAPSVPTLGQRPGDVWTLRHRISDLVAPATYRLRVSFRWSGAHRRVLSIVTRESPRCFQPERRPDLVVAAISVQPGSNPRTNRYVALIRNAGATAAGPFEVEFTYPGAANTRNVTRLASHASVRVTFVGPVCTAATAPTVIADPLRQVDDYNFANNALTATCPAQS